MSVISKKQFTRTYGDSTYRFTKFTVPISEIKLGDEARFQARINDDLPTRAHRIAKDVRLTGSDEFYDPIIVYKLRSKYIVLDGYGRYTAAPELGWDTISVLCLADPTPDAIKCIVQTCNIKHGFSTPLKLPDLQRQAFEMLRDGLSVTDGAARQGVTTITFNRRANAWDLHLQSVKESIDSWGPGSIFKNPAEAKSKTAEFLAGVCKCLKDLKGLKTPEARYQYIQGSIFDLCGVVVTSTKRTDDQIESVCYRFMKGGEDYRELVLLYSTVPGLLDKSLGPIECCNKYAPGNLLVINMSTNPAQMNGEAVWNFLFKKINLTSSNTVV